MRYNFLVRNRGTKSNPAWQLVISYEQDGKWKQKSKGGFASRAEAMSDTAKKLLIDKIGVTTDRDLLSLTLGEFIDIYAADRHLAYRTEVSYKTDIKSLRDGLYDKKIADVTFADLRHALNNITQKDTTKNKTIIVLKTLFHAAQKTYKIIAINPAEDLQCITIRSADSLNVLTDFELKTLLARSRKELQFASYLQIAICAKTGTRVGEMLGLTRDCVDLENLEITINKQWGRIKPESPGVLTGFMPCKTHRSNRTIPIPQSLADEIAVYLQVHPVNFDSRLFTRRSSCGISRIVRNYTGRGIHCLRHTYATKLIAAGTDVKTVAALLGDSVETVLNTYVSYTEDMRIKAKKDIQRLFG